MTLLPEVRRQLYAAAERQTERRSIAGIRLPSVRPSVPQLRLGSLAAAGSVLLVLAIVAIFIGVRGSRSGTSTASVTSIPVSAVPAGTPAAARFVVARMAVLRRPQRAADRLPAPVTAQLKNGPFGFSVIPSLTRLAATFNAGAARSVSVYVIVGRPGGYPGDIATALVVTRGPGHRYLVTPPEVVEEEIAIATGGLAPTVATDNTYFACRPESHSDVRSCQTEPLPKGEAVSVAVVPDGVTRVKWVLNRFPSAASTRLTVYPRVENNVAASTTVPYTAGLVRAIWYAADGQVIKPIPVTRQPSPRRAVPTVVGRSFAVLRGVSANHPVAITNRIGLRLWVVPHPTTVCFQWTVPNPIRPRGGRPIRSSGGGDCVPIAMALAGKFSPASFAPKSETVIGLAPNGNRTVRLTLIGGKTVSVPVAHNVYIARTPKRIRTVTLKDSSGSLKTWRVPDGG